MIRIVFIVTGLSTGGAELMLLKLLMSINRKTFRPHVISLLTSGEVGPKIELIGVPVISLGMKKSWLSFIYLIRLVLLLIKLRPNIVQTWMYHADLIGGIAARIAGITNIVWSIRNYDLSEKLTKKTTHKIALLCAWLSAYLPKQVICCSRRAAEIHAVLGYSRHKIKVIPNGFNINSFRPNAASKASVRNELGIPRNSYLIGLIARYDAQKNHAGFIAAAKTIHKHLPSVYFILAGAGVDQKNKTLKQIIAEHDLATHFRLLGIRNDMPRLMASLDILASSSYSEAFPNVLGEAMACGVTCVVTDVGDSAEIVGETGRVVPSGDMVQLALQILEALCLPHEKKTCLSRKARLRIDRNYNINAIIQQYEDTYKSLLKNNKDI